MSTLSGLLGGAGKPTRITTYTSGSGSFTPLSTSSSWLRVTLVGGGGGGSMTTLPTYTNSGCGGGGSGTATYWIKATDPSYPYQIGAGGTGATPGVPATRGGNTRFGIINVEGGQFGGGNFISPGGGSGSGDAGAIQKTGKYAYAPTAANAEAVFNTGIIALSYHIGGALQGVAGGFGGWYIGNPSNFVTGASPNNPSLNGASGSRPGWGFPGGGWNLGGGDGGSLDNGGTVNPSWPNSGDPSTYGYAGAGGGGSLYGTAGAGGSVQSPWSAATLSGGNATGYGAGGGGGAFLVNQPSNAFGSGGNGSGGLIIIEEFTF